MKAIIRLLLIGLLAFGVACETGGGGIADPDAQADGGIADPDAQADVTEDTTPEDTTPEDTTPEDTTPEDTTPEDTTPDVVPTGDASVSFKPLYVGYAFGFGGSAQIGMNGTDPVVIMLCRDDDPECHEPLMVRDVEEDETNGAPIQTSFGPEITVTGLPTGDYHLMIFSDGRYTDRRITDVMKNKVLTMGLAWYEDFPNPDPKWGGLASEGDMLLIETGDRRTTIRQGAKKPEAKAVHISLDDGETVELGDVELGHAYERDINPHMETENGVLVVSTFTGLRFIDLRVWPYELMEAYDGLEGYPEYWFVDDSGEHLNGQLCGMTRGPGSSIFALFDTGSGSAGFAMHFDVQSHEVLGRVNWPLAPSNDPGHPCIGHYHEHDGQAYLFALGMHALWSANITDLASAGEINGHALGENDDELMEVQTGVRSMVGYQDRLLIGLVPGPSENKVPADARFKRAVFFADIQTDGSLEIRRNGDGAEGLEWLRITNSVLDNYNPTHNSEIECYSSGMGTDSPGLFVADFHDGRELLFAGGCSQVMVFEIGNDFEFTAIDFSGPVPGTAGMDGTLHGHHYAQFVLSPDGDTLWALPTEKSRINFSCQWSDDDRPDQRSEHNRYMAMAIDLSQGARPGLREGVASDIDDYDGHVGLGGGYNSPAEDPGVDLNLTWYTCYQQSLAPNTPGVTNNAGTIPTSPSLAASGTTVWMRGSGAAGSYSSGMGKLGDLASYSIAEQRAFFWPLQWWGAEHDYFWYWTSGVDSDFPMGFDIEPGRNNHLPTSEIIYVPFD